MAKLKATPKSFAEAAQVLGTKSSVRLGNNTFLELDRYDDSIVVRLHKTNIVIFYSDGRVTLHSGGYRTMTTKDRINQFVDGRVFQKDFNWFYAYPDKDRGTMRWSTAADFEEGMVVSDPAWADICPFKFNDIPCVLAKGHDGGHMSTKALAQTK